MLTMEIKLNLEVSAANLDTLWQEHPEETKVWASACADALKEQQEAENALKLILAQTEIKVRQNPVDYGFAKLTEDLVKAVVTTQPAVIEATQKVADSKHSVNVTRAIVDALDVKRSSLKYLSELTISGYIGTIPGIRN